MLLLDRDWSSVVHDDAHYIRDVLHCLQIAALTLAGCANSPTCEECFLFFLPSRARLRADHSFLVRFDPERELILQVLIEHLYSWLLLVSHFCQDLGLKESSLTGENYKNYTPTKPTANLSKYPNKYCLELHSTNKIRQKQELQKITSHEETLHFIKYVRYLTQHKTSLAMLIAAVKFGTHSFSMKKNNNG